MKFSLQRYLRRVLFLGAFTLVGSSAHAVTVGGINFHDNAFADTLISSFGTFTFNGPSLAAVVTDKDPGTYAFSKDAGAYVEVGFMDNNLVNGPGADLALFELGAPPDTFIVSLTINGTTHSYLSAYTFEQAGIQPLNVALVNLDDFGVPDGAVLHSIVLGLSTPGLVTPFGTTVPTLSLVGAINNAAVPDGGSSLLMLLPGLGLLGYCRSKQTA